jgi:hypothetical protein
MYKMTVSGMAQWFSEKEARDILRRRGDSHSSIEAVLRAIRELGPEFFR